MTTSIAIKRFWDVGPTWNWFRLVITTRTSWMANNAIPDSIIMNMICWSLGPPVEFNEPHVCSSRVGLTSKNTLKILNTIKPVTRAFTTMDATKPVRANVFPQRVIKTWPSSIIYAPSVVSQVTRGDKSESACQTKICSIHWPIYVIAKNEGIITIQIFLPHTIQQR